VENKLRSQGGVPVHHTDPPKVAKLDLPKALPTVAPPSRLQKQPPPPPVLPKHTDRPVPTAEPGSIRRPDGSGSSSAPKFEPKPPVPEEPKGNPKPEQKPKPAGSAPGKPPENPPKKPMG
jgi:hypothetical protein